MGKQEHKVRILGGRDGRVPGLQRGLEVLEYLQHCHEGAKIVAIAGALKIPCNSTIRVLNTLHDFGYVARDPESLLYRLTRKMMGVALESARDRTLTECAIGVMRELRDLVTETVVLSVMDSTAAVVLDQVPSLESFRFVCDPGHHQTLHISASPKAILAFLPGVEYDEMLRNYDFKRYTRTTITSREGFDREMALIRKAGYAMDRGEQIDGMHCTAAPVLDRRGYPIAAITVTGPSYRFPLSDLPRVGKIVRRYADRVAERFCGNVRADS